MKYKITESVNELAKIIHQRNIEKGFYEKPKNLGEMLCLMHSEISEALEADRESQYSNANTDALNGWVSDEDFITHYNQSTKGTFEEEMADIFIRLLDLCEYKKIDLEDHVIAKMRYNLSRPKYHNKNY